LPVFVAFLSAPDGVGSGASDDTGSSFSTSSGSVLTLGNSTGDDLTLTASVAAPEASSWSMMLLGFAGLGFLGWRGTRKTASRAA
jgi:hypothetical protein